MPSLSSSLCHHRLPSRTIQQPKIGARQRSLNPTHPFRQECATVPLTQFSPNVARLEASATLVLAARARKLRAAGVPVVDLSAGEPQYPAPAFAARAGIRAVEEGKTGYPPTSGLPELREAIARYLCETTAAEAVDPDASGLSKREWRELMGALGRGD